MVKQAEQKDTTKKEGKVLRGVVVGNKVKNTVAVEVTRYEKHPKYHKFIKSKKKYQVHYEGDTPDIGDKVEIKGCRPISKTKKFSVIQ